MTKDGNNINNSQYKKVCMNTISLNSSSPMPYKGTTQQSVKNDANNKVNTVSSFPQPLDCGSEKITDMISINPTIVAE